MKKIVQRVVTICFLASWVVIGIAAHGSHTEKCLQEWKAGFLTDSSLVKESGSIENTEAERDSKEGTELFLPGRAISILR